MNTIKAWSIVHSKDWYYLEGRLFTLPKKVMVSLSTKQPRITVTLIKEDICYKPLQELSIQEQEHTKACIAAAAQAVEEWLYHHSNGFQRSQSTTLPTLLQYDFIEK